MHEMSYIVRIVNRAIETAQEKGAVRVRRILVSVGEMTDVLPEYLHRYYVTAVKGTLLENSVLETEMEPVRVLCGECRQEYHPDRENGYACPLCKSSTGKVIFGRGVVIKQIELEY